MTNIRIRRELRRLIKGAVEPVPGSGGLRQCKYCLRESFPGQAEHYRVEVKGEANTHCEVTVMRAALKVIL